MSRRKSLLVRTCNCSASSSTPRHVSGRVRSCQVVSVRVRSWPVVSDRVRSCPVVSCRVRAVSGRVSSCPVVSRCVPPCPVVSGRAGRCRAVPGRARPVPGRARPCPAVSARARPCPAVSGRVPPCPAVGRAVSCRVRPCPSVSRRVRPVSGRARPYLSRPCPAVPGRVLPCPVVSGRVLADCGWQHAPSSSSTLLLPPIITFQTMSPGFNIGVIIINPWFIICWQAVAVCVCVFFFFFIFAYFFFRFFRFCFFLHFSLFWVVSYFSIFLPDGPSAGPLLRRTLLRRTPSAGPPPLGLRTRTYAGPPPPPIFRPFFFPLPNLFFFFNLRGLSLNCGGLCAKMYSQHIFWFSGHSFNMPSAPRFKNLSQRYNNTIFEVFIRRYRVIIFCLISLFHLIQCQNRQSSLLRCTPHVRWTDSFRFPAHSDDPDQEQFVHADHEMSHTEMYE